MNYNKDVVTEPVFEEAYPTFDERGRFLVNGKYGYVDTQGEIVIQPRFTTAEDFKHGVAVVTKGRKRITINKHGKRHSGIIALCGTHQCVRPELNQDLVVKNDDGKYQLLLKKKTGLSPDDPYSIDTSAIALDTIVPLNKFVWLLVDSQRISVFETWQAYTIPDDEADLMQFDYSDYRLFGDGMCDEGIDNIVGLKNASGWRYARIDGQGLFEFINESLYDEISSMSRSVALVELNGREVYVDENGNEYVVEPDNR